MTELHGHISETFHVLQQQTDQQRPKHPVAYVGYIEHYYVDDNTVTVIDPMNANPDTQTPMVSPRMPLATGLAPVANGQNPLNPQVQQWGLQIAPFGGASQDQPQAGEQVLVVLMNPEIGYGCCAFLLNNDQARPPGNQIPILGGQLQGGEVLFVSPSGSLIYCDVAGNMTIITSLQQGGVANQSGNIRASAQGGGVEIQTQAPGDQPINPLPGDLNLNSIGNINQNAVLMINISANGQVNIAAPLVNVTAANVNVTATQVQIGSAAELLQHLITETFLLLYNTHVHVDPQGGLTSSPTVQALDVFPNVTAVLQAG